jgi:hypothetical protein
METSMSNRMIFRFSALESHHGLSLKTREISSDSIPQRHPKETLKPEEHRSSVVAVQILFSRFREFGNNPMGIISPTLG